MKGSWRGWRRLWTWVFMPSVAVAASVLMAISLADLFATLRSPVGLDRIVPVQHKDANGKASRDTSDWWDKDRDWECTVWNTPTGLRCIPSKYLGTSSSWYSQPDCSEVSALAQSFGGRCDQDLRFMVQGVPGETCDGNENQKYAVFRIGSAYEGPVWRKSYDGSAFDATRPLKGCHKDNINKLSRGRQFWHFSQEDISAEFAGVEEVHP